MNACYEPNTICLLLLLCTLFSANPIIRCVLGMHLKHIQ